MDSNLQKIIDLKVEKTIKALEKNCMKGYYVKSESELISLIDTLIKDDKINKCRPLNQVQNYAEN